MRNRIYDGVGGVFRLPDYRSEFQALWNVTNRAPARGLPMLSHLVSLRLATVEPLIYNCQSLRNDPMSNSQAKKTSKE